MFIKKFYEAAIAEGGGNGGGETAVLETPEVKETTPTFAEAMAKGGTRTSNDSPAEKPVVIKEVKEEPKKEAEAIPAATATELQTPEKATPESPAKKEPEKVLPPPIAEVPKKVQSWQEVLKSQQPNEVFKELGFDDETVDILNEVKDYKDKQFFKGFLKSLKDGNANDYLKEWTTDYSKMSAEDVMRHQLRLEYPKASEKALNALYEDEIVNKYNLDSEDTGLSENGKLLLEAKADKFRDSLIENQKSKLAPKPPEPKAEVPDNSEAEAKQEFEAYKNKISSDPYYKELADSNEFTIGKGESKFTYPIKTDEISDLLFDNEKWRTAIRKPSDDGTETFVPDVEKQMLIAMIAKYGKDVFSKMAQHYKSLGGKSAIEPIENAKQIDALTVSNTEAKPSNLVEGMAKGGVKVTGAM